MSRHLQSALLRGVFRLLAWLPPRLTGAIGAGLGRMAYYLHPRRRAIAVRNVTRIYPERDRRSRQRLARESFAELGRVIMELPHVFTRSGEYLRSRVEVEGLEAYRDALAEGRGAFVTFYHHGNWELCGILSSVLIPDSHCIYRAIRQPALEAFVKQARERFGATMHPRQEGLRWLPRVLKQGHGVFILVDQHLANGVPIPFLGHLASTTTVPAAFVAKYSVPVFGLTLQRIGHSFRFRMRWWPITMPELCGDKEQDAYRIMERINRSFDDIIRERPELWMWSHQRWKLLEEHPDIAEVVHGTP